MSGGIIVMIEPWYTTWSRFVYNYLHHETFDSNSKDWDFQKGKPLSRSNSALPWIVMNAIGRNLNKIFLNGKYWK